MMATANNDTFYSDLEGFADFRAFSDAVNFAPLPDDWFVVICDVQGSTAAIEQGHYKQVNALGAASIIALLNAVAPLQVPYVFGGDGSTLCVPPSGIDAVKAALAATRLMAQKSFKLGLRTGVVPMSTILKQGKKVLVGRFQPSAQFGQAMFSGGGLAYAEALVKSPEADNPWLVDETTVTPEASFEGFECRWSKIPSPHDEVVAILVQATEQSEEACAELYAEVFDAFTGIYGRMESHHPVREGVMALTNSLRDLATELGVRTAFFPRIERWKYMIMLQIYIFAGRWFMSRNISTSETHWGDYKKNFVANTDFRKFDEALRMVVAGSADQRHAFESWLRKQHEAGRLVYGLHRSGASLATCLVRDYNTDHVHFLDAADGGYALAAKQLKSQLKEMRRPV